MKSKPLIFGSAALLLLVVVGSLALRRSGAAGPSVLSRSSRGWLAARKYMEARGSSVGLLDAPFDTDRSDHSLVLSLPWEIPPSDRDLQALHRRLNAGGTLVYAYSGEIPGASEDRVAQALRLEFHTVHADPPLGPREWYRFRRAGWRLKPEVESTVGDVSIATPSEVPDAPAGAQVLYRGEDGKPVIFAFARGRARVIVLPADALSNGRLSNPGNADLLESVRRALGERILFDEYHHGLSGERSAADSGSASSLDLLLAQLCVLYLLCAWALATGFGPAWQETPPITGSASAFLLGLAALHRELRHSSGAALQLIADVRRYDPRTAIPAELEAAAGTASEDAFVGLARTVSPWLKHRRAS
ncbi:MAG: DUF4350 domain-containing protein [Acidobacteriota bacterium]